MSLFATLSRVSKNSMIFLMFSCCFSSCFSIIVCFCPLELSAEAGFATPGLLFLNHIHKTIPPRIIIIKFILAWLAGYSTFFLWLCISHLFLRQRNIVMYLIFFLRFLHIQD